MIIFISILSIACLVFNDRIDMKITNKRNGILIAGKAKVAKSLFSQLRGLIGYSSFDSDSALILPGCRQIHTFFMRFSIDIIFIDRNNRVIHIFESASPNKVSGYVPDSAAAIEISGGISSGKIEVGDVLLIDNEV